MKALVLLLPDVADRDFFSSSAPIKEVLEEDGENTVRHHTRMYHKVACNNLIEQKPFIP